MREFICRAILLLRRLRLALSAGQRAIASDCDQMDRPMTKTLRAAGLAATLLASTALPALAGYLDHVRVQKEAGPACTIVSPSPYGVYGPFFNHLGPKNTQLPPYGAALDPYPGITDYNALIGQKGAPSYVTYNLGAKAEYFQAALGSLDKGNWIWFYSGDTVVGVINGAEIARQTGTPTEQRDAVTVLMRPSAPYDAVTFGSSTTFEWADMRFDDLPMCQP
jgi:hypothetical protein